VCVRAFIGMIMCAYVSAYYVSQKKWFLKTRSTGVSNTLFVLLLVTLQVASWTETLGLISSLPRLGYSWVTSKCTKES
jgi:hypothetical protein